MKDKARISRVIWYSKMRRVFTHLSIGTDIQGDRQALVRFDAGQRGVQ